MEISGNKYLHKKFKKQTSCNPVYNVEDKNDNSVLATASNTNNGERTSSSEEEPVNFLLFKDNKLVGSVPNYKSTNCDGSLVIESQDSERSAERSANTNVKLDNQSSISNVEVSVNIATNSSVTKEPVDCYNKYRTSDDQKTRSLEPQTISTSNVTSCISKLITTTTTSLLGNELKQNSIRNFSFDTKVSISEPIPNIEKSSILDTVYSKSSLISERPNAAGIKLDVDESTPRVGRTDADSSTTSENILEKKNCTESTGGKYVCTYCNLACSKPSVLQKHIRAHTNERPYPCVSCGFSFKTRSNLYKHCRSRTHANRVMGNKHVQAGQMETLDVDGSSEKSEDRLDCTEETEDNKNMSIMDDKPPKSIEINLDNAVQPNPDVVITPDQRNVWEQKSKPYKPRFHTAKLFFEENKLKENDAKLDNVSNLPQIHIKSPRKSPNPEIMKNRVELHEPQIIRTNPDLLKLRINELINKNNSIVNCDDAVVIRRRNMESINENNNEYFPSHHVQWHHQPAEYRNTIDEPLNLTAKNRKRCLSDSDNTNKSLIKELLLKNLSSDPNLQCPYCKMIFQTVTELEMHKIKYCNAKHSNIRYARSSSVNVASILTQNKNAFDNIPHMQHTTFPLKSPGPCLGKTRLIDSEKPGEKYRTFSFDDNVIMHHSQSDSPSFNKYMLQSPVGSYPLSPQIKKNPIKLFGGEVKITQTSGETRSFKIESESINKMEEPHHFMEFSGNLSENLVIKSTLQSGGTVLQNKANYSPKMDSLPSPNIIRVYENAEMSPSNLNLPILNDKSKFTYDKISQPNIRQNDKLLIVANNEMLMKRRFPVRDKVEQNYTDNSGRNTDIKSDSEKDKEIYKSNLMDFGQKAVKLLAPNLKPPNLTIPGLPIPSAPGDRSMSSPIVTIAPLEINTSLMDNIIDRQHQENLNFAKKQISLQQRMAEVSQPQTVFNPMNIVVNGKVIRYVPGMPGPVVADTPAEMSFNTRLTPSSKLPKSPRPFDDPREVKEKVETPTSMLPVLNGVQFERKTPTIIVDQHDNKPPEPKLLIQNRERMNNVVSRVSESKVSPTATVSSPEKTSKEESRKFVRPTSLALKPNSVAFKNHHGLTPTMFNQALISPDTPRVAKKYCQQYLNGNYFSYLGLKSSTKSVYCTLNKTQPFYVKHFKKLSMYSEWRQQESKIDSLSVSAYDSRQRQQKYTMSGHAKANLVAHSSYKFVKTETTTSKEEKENKNSSVLGGYESNEDYTYIRGRGRGRYVCDQCGIRCKKPSMLKKHIRTHSDDRPYTCEHCNFSFKTKGNLTKHMKSKAHSKKYAATSSTSTQNSVTSSESEDSDAESSDESTRLQEHEAAHCLLSLSQKNTQPVSSITQESNSSSTSPFSSSSTTVSFSLTEFPNFLKGDTFLKNPDQINQVANTNFAKNKILDENPVNFNATKHLTEVFDVPTTSCQDSSNVSQYLGKSSTIRPLTYPYQQTQLDLDKDKSKNSENLDHIPKIITSAQQEIHQRLIKPVDNKFIISSSRESISQEPKYPEIKIKRMDEVKQIVSSSQMSLPIVRQDFSPQNVEGNLPANIVFRKRKLSTSSNVQYKVQRSDVEPSSKAVDLSMPIIQDSPILDLSPAAINGEPISFNGAFISSNNNDSLNNKLSASISKRTLILNHENHINPPRTVDVISDPQIMYNVVNSERVSEPLIVYNQIQKPRHNSFSESNSSETFSQSSDTNDRVIGKMVDIPENSMPSDKIEMYKSSVHVDIARSQSKTPEYGEQDQSAMQTLAEIAIKQVKLEKNILAKNVASEYLKLALNNEGSNQDGNMKKFASSTKEPVNELMVKPEESKNCSICSKNFSKPSQLRLHMNIHYLERPFRCESCSVSFRTRGHLQKHERSASHHNKLSSSPALSSQEPRPFKCSDCNIAFRIHGHLAKHLRSKMHIMKLECLAKIPFGLYAELERANSLLTEINTTDGDLCLESLKILARKLFSNDPSKLDQLGNTPDNRDS